MGDGSFVGHVLLFSLVVLVLDTLGALAAQRLGFRYTELATVSLLIYFTVGWTLYPNHSIALAAVAGMVVGLVDSTLGWAISWKIGPGKPQDASRNKILTAVVTVPMLAAFFSAFAAGLKLMSSKG